LTCQTLFDATVGNDPQRRHDRIDDARHDGYERRGNNCADVERERCVAFQSERSPIARARWPPAPPLQAINERLSGTQEMAVINSTKP
jgi:hypothetical protein